MEAGYFPAVLGVLLIALGVLIAANAWRSVPPRIPRRERFSSCRIGAAFGDRRGVLSFIVFGAFFGLAPATFSCVFISALGDRTSTLRGACTLATIMTVVAIGVFWYVLQVQFPLLHWL